MPSASALQGKQFKSFGVDPKILLIVGLDTDDGPEHPLYDERINLPIDEALVRSLSRYGNVQDVLVRKDRKTGRIEVVFGRQRVRAMRVVNQRLKKSGQPARPIVARNVLSDDLTAFGKSVTENSLRRDDTTMGKAHKMDTMLRLSGTDAECAVAFGVSTTAIRQWKKLLTLDPKVQEAIDSGEFSASAAMNLADLEPSEQVAQLEQDLAAQKAGEGKATFAATKRKRQNRGNDSKHKTAFAPPRRPILAKVAVFSDPKSNKHEGPRLSKGARTMLDWVLGKVDADAIPGLSEVLTAMEQAANELSKAQKEIVGTLDGTEGGAVLASSLNKKTVSALVKRSVVEHFEHADGLQYVRRVPVTEDATPGAAAV